MKALIFALAGTLFALSLSRPAYAYTLQVVNTTNKVATVTVTYYTNFCKDDRGVQIAPKGKFSVSVGICKVKAVYASVTTMPGLALACIPRNGTGAETYFVNLDANLKNCHVD